jgi:hypothetical protein
MARTVIEIGDVFEVLLNDASKKYFQVIAFDSTQLSSSVIRVFKKRYNPTEILDLSEIVRDEVDFYAHCSAKLGVKLNLWQKIGNIMETGKLDDIIFRDTNDYGHKLGEEPIRISNKWYVWKINEEFIDVGKLTGKYREAEIGVVVNPASIVHRMQTGEYNFWYPGY